jgi:hypothetical protein
VSADRIDYGGLLADEQMARAMEHQPVGAGLPSRRQLFEQRLSFLQIERVEAFGEPAVDRREQIESFSAVANDRDLSIRRDHSSIWPGSWL